MCFIHGIWHLDWMTEYDQRIFSKNVYEHLVVVGKMLEEGEKAGERRNLGKSGL